MTTTEQVLSASDARTFAVDVLRVIGMPDEDAAITADSMVWAGLRGAVSHSLMRLDQIAKRAEGGGLSLVVDWTPLHQEGNTTLMDAGYGWGIVAGTRGMWHAVEAARTHGVGVTSVRNCDVTSIMGWYPSHAVSADMIGLAINNGTPLMPAWGGAGKLIGNQAFAIATPAGRNAPIYLDMGIGAASLGELSEAAKAGTPLRQGVLVNAKGEPTTDAADWREGGALLPMGGHRGYGLAVMWEMLTGVLAGGHTLSELGAPNQFDRRAGSCLFLMAVDPSAFLPYEEFVDRVDQLIDQIHASPPAPGVDRVRVPGEDRARLAEQRERDGIPFPADQVGTLTALADRLGVRWPG